MSESITNSLSDATIYKGFWTNWSHGPIQGATLTLTKDNGGFLSAFLALYVTLVGTSFWRLFCFAAHSLLSAKGEPQDGLYHQRQAIFRNSATGSVGLQYFFQVAWNWRNNARRSWMRVLPLFVLTVVIMVCFSASSILTSKVSHCSRL